MATTRRVPPHGAQRTCLTHHARRPAVARRALPISPQSRVIGSGSRLSLRDLWWVPSMLHARHVCILHGTLFALSTGISAEHSTVRLQSLSPQPIATRHPARLSHHSHTGTHCCLLSHALGTSRDIHSRDRNSSADQPHPGSRKSDEQHALTARVTRLVVAFVVSAAVCSPV